MFRPKKSTLCELPNIFETSEENDTIICIIHHFLSDKDILHSAVHNESFVSETYLNRNMCLFWNSKLYAFMNMKLWGFTHALEFYDGAVQPNGSKFEYKCLIIRNFYWPWRLARDPFSISLSINWETFSKFHHKPKTRRFCRWWEKYETTFMIDGNITGRNENSITCRGQVSATWFTIVNGLILDHYLLRNVLFLSKEALPLGKTYSIRSVLNDGRLPLWCYQLPDVLSKTQEHWPIFQAFMRSYETQIVLVVPCS